MATQWDYLVLDYLAQRLPQTDDSLLEGAIEVAPENVKSFLRRYRDFRLDDKTSSASLGLAREARLLREALLSKRQAQVIELLEIDALSVLPYAYLHFAPEQVHDDLVAGIEEAHRAAEIARRLDHGGCEAHYLTIKGQALYITRESPDYLKLAAQAFLEARTIYKKLEQLHPGGVYGPLRGVTRVFLMRVRREQNEYAKAQNTGRKALDLLQTDLPAFQEVRALAERDLASVLRETGHLEEARQLCEAALSRFKGLVPSPDSLTHRSDRFDRDDYEAQVAFAEITLASILVKTSRTWEMTASQLQKKFGPRGQAESLLRSAEEYLQEAQGRFHEMLEERRRSYAGGQAMIHYTRGLIYEARARTHETREQPNESRESWEGALRSYKSSIQIWSGSGANGYAPGANKHYAAGARRRMGVVYRELKMFDEAEIHFRRADEALKTLSLPLGQSLIHFEWALLEDARNNQQEAAAKCRTCIQLSEVGLKNLDQRAHDALFRWKIRGAHIWLTRHLARRAQVTELTTEEKVELILHLENLRSLETPDRVPSRGEAILPLNASTSQAQSEGLGQQIQGFLNGTHPLSARFRENKAAFLWVQAAGDEVILVALQPQELRIEIGGSRLVQSFDDAAYQTERLGVLCSRRLGVAEGSGEEEKRRVAQQIQEARQTWCATQLDLVYRSAYNSLPKTWVREFLEGASHEIIFLSPCEKTIEWPFEMLRKVTSIGFGFTRKGGYGGYLGLRVVMPRFNSLTELLEDVIHREPDWDKPRALIVGDPAHSPNQPALIGAKVSRYAVGLRKKKIYLVPKGRALRGKSATLASVMEGLDSPNVCLWLHVGHGVPSSGSGEGTCLPLANGRFLYPTDLDAVDFPNTIVFLDGCQMGLSTMHLSGQLNGFPPTLLRRGASCVLVSMFTLYDDLSAPFTLELAQAAFDDMECRNTSQAVLAARRKTFLMMSEEANFVEHPLAWGLVTLWGNPMSALYRPNGTPDTSDDKHISEEE